jgi:hypothetical protein
VPQLYILAHTLRISRTFLGKAHFDGMLVVNEIHRALEERLGRKLAPDRRNVEADVQVQEDWKKTSGTTCPHPKRVEKARASPVDVSRRSTFRAYLGKSSVRVFPAGTSPMPQQDQPGIPLCLWRREYRGWSMGQLGIAASKYGLYADLFG